MATVDTTSDKFIGKGLIFPIVLNASGRPDIKGGKELLEASMVNILSWTIGTRFFLGEYGTNLEQLLQEPNDITTQALVKHYTAEVIAKWEQRVEILEVQLLSKDDYSLDISIVYKIKNTKLEETFIFPYYSQLIY